jgi:hypothetical protein
LVNEGSDVNAVDSVRSSSQLCAVTLPRPLLYQRGVSPLAYFTKAIDKADFEENNAEETDLTATVAPSHSFSQAEGKTAVSAGSQASLNYFGADGGKDLKSIQEWTERGGDVHAVDPYTVI